MLIKGGTIHIGNGTVIHDGFVLTDDDKILAVGRLADMDAKVVSGHDIIDATGCTITPGFIDAHCHIGMWEDSMGFEGDDGNEDTDPCTPQLRALDAINPMDKAFSDALYAGITTVVSGPGSSNAIGGQFCALKTVGRCVDDMVLLPVAAMKFALGENPKVSFHQKNQAPITRMAIAAIIREQLAKAKRYAEQKERAEEDSEIDPPEFDPKCEAMLPVLSGAVAAHFHAHRADDIFTAIRLGKEYGLRVVIIHCTEGYLIADALQKEGIGIICGPVLQARTKPELSGSHIQNAAVLLQAGIPVAIATDHPELPIDALSLSAAIAATAGLNREEALAAITSHAAALYGLGNRIGSLQKGRDADLLIFAGDPFALMSKPQTVMVNGKIVHTILP